MPFPGCSIRIKDGRIVVDRYWPPENVLSGDNRSSTELCDESVALSAGVGASDRVRTEWCQRPMAARGASFLPKAIHADLERFRESIPPPERSVSFHIGRLLGCIQRELFNPNLNVKTLKRLCDVRDNNVSSRFKCEMGVYLSSYITRLRLEAAILLLRGSDLSVAEVALFVGYPNLQTFYRAFKRHFLCTPAEFRVAGEALQGDRNTARYVAQ